VHGRNRRVDRFPSLDRVPPPPTTISLFLPNVSEPTRRGSGVVEAFDEGGRGNDRRKGRGRNGRGSLAHSVLCNVERALRERLLSLSFSFSPSLFLTWEILPGVTEICAAGERTENMDNLKERAGGEGRTRKRMYVSRVYGHAYVYVEECSIRSERRGGEDCFFLSTIQPIGDIGNAQPRKSAIRDVANYKFGDCSIGLSLNKIYQVVSGSKCDNVYK